MRLEICWKVFMMISDKLDHNFDDFGGHIYCTLFSKAAELTSKSGLSADLRSSDKRGVIKAYNVYHFSLIRA